MKKILVLMVLLSLSSCLVEPVEEIPLTAYTPVLMQRADLEKSLAVLPPREIKQAGKIYIYGSMLYINERYRGVHVFDNSDPTNPTAIAFLNIPGNIDIAIKNGVMYADNSVDLVSLDYDGQGITTFDRQRNVFPEVVPPDFGRVPSEFLTENRPENTVIVRWEEKE